MWYDEEKVFFQCKQCGKCCKRRGVVDMDSDDVRRACQYLEIKDADFRTKYLASDGVHDFIPVSRGSVCVFLLPDNTCRIHDAKPKQCSSYPFWPNIMADRGNWYREAIKCKGINKAKQVNVAERLPKAELIAEVSEEQALVLATYVMCNENKKVDKDGKCYSRTCAFQRVKRAESKIDKEGCTIYLEAQKYDRQNESGISGSEVKEDTPPIASGGN